MDLLLESIPLELQQLIFSKIPFKYFYVSLVCRRWNKLFWQTRTSIVLHKDTGFRYEAKLNNEDEFNALLTKLRPELIERIAQQNDSFLISNLDKFKNLTSFTEYKRKGVNNRAEENNVQIYSTLKNLPKLKHLDLQFENAAREEELFEIIAACTSLETLSFKVTHGYYFTGRTTPYLTRLKRLKDLNWPMDKNNFKELADAGIQLTKLIFNHSHEDLQHISLFTNLKSIVMYCNNTCNTKTIEALAALTTLEEIDLPYLAYDLLPDLQKLSSLKNLKRFTMYGTTQDLTQGLEQKGSPFSWVTKLPSLKCLQVNTLGHGLPDNLSQCTALKELKINVETMDEMLVLVQLTQLEDLVIEEGNNFKNMADVVPRLTHLKRLTISFGFGDDLMELSRWSQLQALTRLEIENIGDVTEDEILRLIAAMPNLKQLFLHGNRIAELNTDRIPNTSIKFISTLSEADRFWMCEYTKHIRDTVHWRFFDTNLY